MRLKRAYPQAKRAYPQAKRAYPQPKISKKIPNNLVISDKDSNFALQSALREGNSRTEAPSAEATPEPERPPRRQLPNRSALSGGNSQPERPLPHGALT